MKRARWIPVTAMLLAACGVVAGTPERAVERYVEALVASDQIGAVNAACTGDEMTAMLESAAYQGVDSQLEDFKCELIGEDGNAVKVACSGRIRFSYAGGEDQVDELEGRTFLAVIEAGEWKACSSAANGIGSEEVVLNDATQTPFIATEVVESEQAEASATPDLSPTPDVRPLAEDWRTWPVYPELSPWLIETYEKGIAAGNNPQRFTKAGDCQNIPEAFMGLYDDPGRFRPRDNEEYLQETIDYFAGSWSHDGISLDGGFNFPAIFTPLRADATLCEDSETPLACEIRVYKPSFIIISMEFVYEGRTAQNYEDYLRQAVDYALAQNVIPVLITKADNVEGGHRINLATAQVAYDYDIPLINWWRAAQPLSGHGIDWARDAGIRPEGFHITYEAWGVRSYVGLKAMDGLWRAAEGE